MLIGAWSNFRAEISTDAVENTDVRQGKGAAGMRIPAASVSYKSNLPFGKIFLKPHHRKTMQGLLMYQILKIKPQRVADGQLFRGSLGKSKNRHTGKIDNWSSEE